MADRLLTEEMRRELVASWTTLIDQWHDGVKNPDMWMAAAAGALTAARALLTHGVMVDAEPRQKDDECSPRGG